MAPTATSPADSPPVPDPQNQENHLQPFIVLHKGSAQGPVAKSGKARRRIDLSSEVEGREESDERLFEHLRMEAYKFVWSKIEFTIKDVLKSINTDVFNAIHQWVRESFEAIRSYGTPALLEATRPYPVVTDATSKQLFTGLVLTKNMEFVDDILTFEELGIHLKSNECHVAKLSSSDFSVKNGIGGCLRSLLRQFIDFTLEAADVSILASWYSEQGSDYKPVVVIVDDMERCCNSVLSDFILTLSEWVVKIPVILIMGTATFDASRNILPSNSLQRLCLFKFSLGSPAERMDAVVKSILVNPCFGFSIGHKVVIFFRNYFLIQDGTLTSFIRALKIACVLHFSTEPLSFMLKWLSSKENSQEIGAENYGLVIKAIHKYAVEFPSHGSTSEMQAVDSELLVHKLSELERLQKCWTTVVLCLHEAGKFNQVQLFNLLCEALDPDLFNSRASRLHPRKEKDSGNSSLRNPFIHQETHGLAKGGYISQAVRKVRELPPVVLHQLLVSWVNHTKKVAKTNVELHSLLKYDDVKNLKKKVTEILMINKSQNHPTLKKEARVFNEKAATWLESVVRDCMKPIECIPFHEIVCFRSVDKLQLALIGDARKTIQVDLLEFQKILHCGCCSKIENNLLPSMPDTAILYTLAQEHGDLINLHDWYQSFKLTLLQRNTKRKHKPNMSPSSKKRKDIKDPLDQSEASLQARFCRAVIELQITGLLRMPSKRRPDYVQRVAFGL